MLGLGASSRLHRPAQQHYNPKQVIHGAGAPPAGLQTRGHSQQTPAPAPTDEEFLLNPGVAQSQSLHRSPESGGLQGKRRGNQKKKEKGKERNPGLCSPAQRADSVGGLLWCEVGGWGCRSHGSLCGGPDDTALLLCPQVKGSQGLQGGGKVEPAQNQVNQITYPQW